MRWIADRKGDSRDWHPYFAWFPVWTDEGDCAWLETVERKWEVRPVVDYFAGAASNERVYSYRLTPIGE